MKMEIKYYINLLRYLEKNMNKIWELIKEIQYKYN